MPHPVTGSACDSGCSTLGSYAVGLRCTTFTYCVLRLLVYLYLGYTTLPVVLPFGFTGFYYTYPFTALVGFLRCYLVRPVTTHLPLPLRLRLRSRLVTRWIRLPLHGSGWLPHACTPHTHYRGCCYARLRGYIAVYGYALRLPGCCCRFLYVTRSIPLHGCYGCAAHWFILLPLPRYHHGWFAITITLHHGYLLPAAVHGSLPVRFYRYLYGLVTLRIAVCGSGLVYGYTRYLVLRLRLHTVLVGCLRWFPVIHHTVTTVAHTMVTPFTAQFPLRYVYFTRTHTRHRFAYTCRGLGYTHCLYRLVARCTRLLVTHHVLRLLHHHAPHTFYGCHRAGLPFTGCRIYTAFAVLVYARVAARAHHPFSHAAFTLPLPVGLRF